MTSKQQTTSKKKHRFSLRMYNQGCSQWGRRAMSLPRIFDGNGRMAYCYCCRRAMLWSRCGQSVEQSSRMANRK